LRPAGKIVHEKPISKVRKVKWTGGVAQDEEHQLWKWEALQSHKKSGASVSEIYA
jgi:hypothetical protein